MYWVCKSLNWLLQIVNIRQSVRNQTFSHDWTTLIFAKKRRLHMGGNRNIWTFANVALIYKRKNDGCKHDEQLWCLQTSHGTFANVLRLHIMSGNIDTVISIQHQHNNYFLSDPGPHVFDSWVGSLSIHSNYFVFLLSDNVGKWFKRMLYFIIGCWRMMCTSCSQAHAPALSGLNHHTRATDDGPFLRPSNSFTA